MGLNANSPYVVAAKAAARRRVLDACLGFHIPPMAQVARRARVSDADARLHRTDLLRAGLLSASMFSTDVFSKEDDPFAERPDDPDADEIRARIAEVRATKEAQPRPRGSVPRARLHHATRPGHWRISM